MVIFGAGSGVVFRKVGFAQICGDFICVWLNMVGF